MNVPHPTRLEIGSTVMFRHRLYLVIQQNQKYYLIKDSKNGRLRWVRPDQVQVVALPELV